MKVAITGATGLIGRPLCRSLLADGHELVILSRNPDKAKETIPDATALRWVAGAPLPAEAIEGSQAVINLAGTPIAEKRWSDKRKAAIRDSRVMGTKNVVTAIGKATNRPRILINGSAVGYYGSRQDEELTERSKPGDGFLSDVCVEWETEAAKATELGVRVVLLRTGIVLSTEGGALAKMLLPFKMFVGGPLGTGKQWMSWIHLDDQVSLILHALGADGLQGPLNATAPNPVTNREFSKTLGRVLGRPAFMPTPGFALKMVFGEMAESLLLEGQKVLPERTLESGFSYRYPELEGALRSLLD